MHSESTQKENEEQKQTLRRLVFVAWTGWTILVFYGSLVPLNYEPVGWDATFTGIMHAPWLELSVSKRADWVANGLIMIPITFLGIGWMSWKTNSRPTPMLAVPLILIFSALLILCIETLQLWFPPRSVSLNDIVAEMIGAFAGVILWLFFGTRCLNKLSAFLALPPSIDRMNLLTDTALVFVLLASLMPMDLMISKEEWQQKFLEGRLTLIPFDDFSTLSSLKPHLLNCLQLFPFAFWAGIRWPQRRAMLAVIAWGLLLETSQMPMFSRTFSMSTVCIVIPSGLLASYEAPRIWTWLCKHDCSRTWWYSAIGYSCILVCAYQYQYQETVMTSAEITSRFRSMFVTPFSRAHLSSELDAGVNICLKLLSFAILGFLLTGWATREKENNTCTSCPVRKAIALASGTALSVELLQIFLPPAIPDLTDLFIYAGGLSGGWLCFQLLIPKSNAETDPKPSK